MVGSWLANPKSSIDKQSTQLTINYWRKLAGWAARLDLLDEYALEMVGSEQKERSS